MYNTIFEHLKRDMTLIPKEKTSHGHKYPPFNDARKLLETAFFLYFFLFFFFRLQSTVIHPGRLQPNTVLAGSVQKHSICQIKTKWVIIFRFHATQIYILAIQKDSINPWHKVKVKSAYEPGGPSGRRLTPVSVA